MSADSLDQFGQARTGNYSDWHPPLMSFLLGCFDRIHQGPSGMLIFQNVLFWSGLGMMMADLFGHTLLAWLFIVVVGFSPPLFGLLGTIWKDVALGASLV